jgi:DNA-binding XRE family transcriptional regulator
MPRVIAKDKLREVREALGSQQDFVDLLKIYHPTIGLQAYSSYERGFRTVDVEIAKTIALMLSKPIFELFESKKGGK